MNKKHLRIGLIIGILLLSALSPKPLRADEEEKEEVHYLAFASDYHTTEGSIYKAFTGMPGFASSQSQESVEYVSLVGDMVGERGGDHPVYDSSMILDLVKEALPKMGNENTSIIWADHDMGVQDDAGIVKGMGGYESGPIFTGKKRDGTPAYYIYCIGFYDMLDGGETSRNAAQAFKTWADGIDKSVPIIVLCHAPIQALRGDNLGAMYWNEALNYAATGVEGITSTGSDETIIRNVFFFHGHNHTSDKNEYFFQAGTTMSVQADTSLLTSNEDAQESDTFDEEYYEENYEEEYDEHQGEEFSFEEFLLAFARATGIESDIYYNSLTVGYLKTSGNATLMSITEDSITLTKMNDGENVDVGVNANKESVGQKIVIENFRKTISKIHSKISIVKKNEDDETLSGAKFSLSDDKGNEAFFEGGTFVIASDDEKIGPMLAVPGKDETLTLKETQAPKGYLLSQDPKFIRVHVEEKIADLPEDHVYDALWTYKFNGGEEEIVFVDKKKEPVTLKIVISGSGHLNVDGIQYGNDSIQAKADSVLTLKPEASGGYQLTSAVLNGTDILSLIDSSYSLLCDEDKTIVLVFTKNKLSEKITSYQIPITGVE